MNDDAQSKSLQSQVLAAQNEIKNAVQTAAAKESESHSGRMMGLKVIVGIALIGLLGVLAW